jgi:CelD/BcsL family acetyltransferase involved in cellulose biosynthesis
MGTTGDNSQAGRANAGGISRGMRRGRMEEQSEMPASGRGYQLSWLTPQEIDDSSRIRDEWDRLARSGNNPYALYQSPVWWDQTSLNLDHGDRCALLLVKEADGNLAGIVPVQTHLNNLRYRFRSRTLRIVPLRLLLVLGSQPMIRHDEGLFVEVIRCLLSAFPDCDGIEMPCVLWDSYVGGVIRDSHDLRKHAVVYLAEEMTDCHLLVLPGSFEEYLSKFKPKARYNLRRQVKRLRERRQEPLDLVRVEHERDVRAFLDVAARLSPMSRQFRGTGWRTEDSPEEYQKLAQLANGGVLRSYFLRCREDTYAYVKGFQYNDVYYYSRVGFDERWEDYSPGTVLLYLLIEDLYSHRQPKRVNFGGGDFWYKDRFATDILPEMPVLLLRRNLRNYLLAASHAGFRSCLRVLKRLSHPLPRT